MQTQTFGTAFELREVHVAKIFKNEGNLKIRAP